MPTEYAAVAARPCSPFAPPGALALSGTGPAWRDTLNLIAQDGWLRPRPGIKPVTGYELTEYATMESAAVLTEMPLLIIAAHAAANTTAVSAPNPPCGAVYGFPDEAPFCAVITSRQAFVRNTTTASWINVTPTYTTGTVTATNGSASVTGAGTAWVTRGISPYQFIEIGGVWYQICDVASDTSLTLTTNFTGTTGGGKAYTIRRTWDLSPGGLPDHGCLVSGIAYAENLYFGGRFMSRADGNLAPCVIRVQNIYDAAPSTDYLTARTALEVGLDNITTLEDITGLAALQDGRIVFTGNGSTVFYSSPTNQKLWTVAPAGNTLVTLIEGAINALGRIGDTLTLHYDNGIVLAYPTGLTDPPLSFRPSRADVGCFAPRTLRSIAGVEIFMTRSSGIGVFDLDEVHHVDADVRQDLIGISPFSLRNGMWACEDPHLNHYHIFNTVDASTDVTRFWTLDVKTGAWWRNAVATVLTAGCGLNPFANRRDGHLLLGARSNNAGVERATGLLHMFSEQETTDVTKDSTAAAAVYRFETDDLDFGAPISYKSPVRAVIWTRSRDGNSSVGLVGEVSVDSGNTWTGSFSATVNYTLTEERAKQLSFLDAAPASLAPRVRITLSQPFCDVSRFLFEVNVSGEATRVEL